MTQQTVHAQPSTSNDSTSDQEPATNIAIGPDHSRITIDLCRARRAKVGKLEFTLIVQRLYDDHLELADLVAPNTLLNEYARFLALAGTFTDRPIVPSAAVDLFWHQHILDTQRYVPDCLAIFGTAVHHYPYMGFDGVTTQSDLALAYQQTVELYRNVFGEPTQPIWSPQSFEACGGGGGGPFSPKAAAR